MENAADALKLAFYVILFVLALTLSITTFSKAKETSDIVIQLSDDSRYYEYEQITTGDIEENVVDENGEVNAVEKTVEVINPNEHSVYAKCFDESCAGWSKDPEFNLMFIRRQQDYANEVLTKRGYIFLNEVYKMLGFQATKAGQIVGWFYDPENPDHTGDNYVDFGIYDVHKEKNRDFVNGYERCIWLDFNVDGNILDLI